MKKVLITGSAGFAGRHMISYLRSFEMGLTVVGTDLQEPADNACDHFYKLDLSDAGPITEMIQKESPDSVIHLAGIFGTEDIPSIYQVNVISAVTLLEAIRRFAPHTVVLAAGSAAEYGQVESEKMPIREEEPCRPVTPYGQSKYLATLTLQYYHRVHNLCTIVVRPFQLIGKGVTDRLAPGAFAKRLKEVVKSSKQEITVGNLKSSRDFLDIHDAVRAMWMLCQNPIPGEIFNLCSGQPVKMQDLLNLMIHMFKREIHPVTDPSYIRDENDINIIYGSFNKINKYCGWKPEKSLPQSVQEMLE